MKYELWGEFNLNVRYGNTGNGNDLEPLVQSRSTRDALLVLTLSESLFGEIGLGHINNENEDLYEKGSVSNRTVSSQEVVGDHEPSALPDDGTSNNQDGSMT